MKGLSRQLAIALEAVGIAAVSVGLAIEVVLHGDVGFMVVTGGSLVVAAGAMIFAKLLRK